MKNMNQKGGVINSLLVGLLAVGVIVQSFFLYRLYTHREEKATSIARTPAVITAKQSSSAPAVTANIGRKNPPRHTAVTGKPGNTCAVQSMDPFGGIPDDWFALSTNDWDPFTEMRRMQSRMNRLFENSFNRFRVRPGVSHQWDSFSFSPETDISDDGNNYIVQFNLPGAEKSNIHVRIKDRILTVSGQTREKIEKKNKSGRTYCMERRQGQFERSITLPGSGDGRKMKAEYKDGVLTVTIPKKESEEKSMLVKVQ